MSDIEVKSSNLENLQVGRLSARWSARGDRILRYHIDFRHTVLNLHKEVSAPELFILQNKVDALLAAWDAKYDEHQRRTLFQSGKEAADEATANATLRQESLYRILDHTLKVNDAVDWEALKDHSEYERPRKFPESKPMLKASPEPQYQAPAISFWDVLFGRKKVKLQETEQAYQRTRDVWRAEKTRRAEEHERQTGEWQRREEAFWAEHARLESDFLEERSTKNAIVDQLRTNLAGGDPQAVVEHASLVLDASDYGGLFEKSFNLQYHADEKLLLVAYDLPCPDTLPSVKSVKFIKATGEMKESYISDRNKKANFEAVAYQVCLRTLHELFEADEYDSVDNILFNGHVNFIDRRTGREARSCLLSILASRHDFDLIDLARVEPKTCFKSLKGISAAQLSSLTSIPPVMEMDREDSRFIDSKDVAFAISEETNIASMSWEDFEHLVREVFEKEFEARGGEVRVTQTSSDGGVDAIAFDPDPISGGKIIIQAKRYTKTVGVSAVRDLYGTVMNEGASKGILVTTADYGPDAYKFVTGKPLTLLTGSHLLHMLERHGYRAKIDLKEAREIARAATIA